MAVPGALYGAKIGPDKRLAAVVDGFSTFAMAGLNSGWCARFVATQAKDIKSVKVHFATVTAAGTIEARIETIDGTTGKPSGTLYDAAATKSFTPVAGWQTVTFDVLPTTNMTAGTMYGLVLLTTTGGTAHTINSTVSDGDNGTSLPCAALTAADGTTRSNFAVASGSHSPIASLILDDDTEDPMGLIPYAASTNHNTVTTAGVAMKVVTVGTMLVAGVEFRLQKVGTPAGDLRIRIFDSGNSTVANSTYTLDKDVPISARNHSCLFAGLVSLAAGTYRVVFDSASSVDSSNCWRLSSSTPVTTAVAPSSYIISTCPDVGTPVWTDSATANQPPVRLIIDSITASSGGANLLAGKL